MCHWNNINQELDTLLNKIESHEKVSIPFVLLSLVDNLEAHKKAAEIYVEDKYPSNHTLGQIKQYPKHQKIRLGYFSADFHNHATMYLINDLFKFHDRKNFELYAFSFGPDIEDDHRKLARSFFSQFIDVNNKSDSEVALTARQLEIDIAIDLKGYTKDLRTGIFSYRAAPIQVNYLGYPGTMGASYMDYIIADSVLIPESSQQYYSEKIAYLPNSYQANVKDIVISDKVFTRKDMGLPQDVFVFCSFNNNYKITPETFNSWMRILQAVKDSVLWIFKENDFAVENLKKEAELRGVDSSRLYFASRLPVKEHLKRIQMADLFLDTFPYNAHTTASDALRVGLPIVTLSGQSFASRGTASLLSALKLSELITFCQSNYEALAIEIAINPEKLKIIKYQLIGNLKTSPLYNSELFTQNIECIYQEMYHRYNNSLDLDHIHI